MMENIEAIKIMDEIEDRSWYTDRHGNIEPLRLNMKWRSLRKAIEAQTEELEQARARIGRLEDTAKAFIKAVDDLSNDGDFSSTVSPQTDLEMVIDETDRQSLAAVKAEALREFADSIVANHPPKEKFFSTWARDRADRIEREAGGELHNGN